MSYIVKFERLVFGNYNYWLYFGWRWGVFFIYKDVKIFCLNIFLDKVGWFKFSGNEVKDELFVCLESVCLI